MNQLPSWVGRVQSIWIALGTFLTLLVFQGVALPAFLTSIFSQQTFEIIVQTLTAVFTFYQYVKGIFVVLPKAPYTEVSTMSNEQATGYAFNPFRIKP